MRYFVSLVFSLSFIFCFAQEKNPQRYGVSDKDVPKGLAVGEKAPEIKLKDQHGKNFLLSDALEDGPVVLTFYRGNWCPYCTRFLVELSTFAGDIENEGARVIAVSPERASELVKTGGKTHKNITLLSDMNGDIMKAYDVDFQVTNEYQTRLGKSKTVDLATHNDQEVAVLPVAATYIIDKNGEIVYRHFDLNYEKRASLQEMLAVLEDL